MSKKNKKIRCTEETWNDFEYLKHLIGEVYRDSAGANKNAKEAQRLAFELQTKSCAPKKSERFAQYALSGLRLFGRLKK